MTRTETSTAAPRQASVAPLDDAHMPVAQQLMFELVQGNLQRQAQADAARRQRQAAAAQELKARNAHD
jgi:hypothetical protein